MHYTTLTLPTQYVRQVLVRKIVAFKIVAFLLTAALRVVSLYKRQRWTELLSRPMIITTYLLGLSLQPILIFSLKITLFFFKFSVTFQDEIAK